MATTDGEAGDCPTCGRPLEHHNRHVRYRLPDPVVALREQEGSTATWMSHEDANSSVMMQVPGAGPFCRALLPVLLEGGYTVHFGVWIGIHPADLQRAFAVWWSPEYTDLKLVGVLANDLPKFGGLGSPVRLAVLDPDHTPTVVDSTAAGLAEVLRREWHHEDLLPYLPD